MPTVEDFGKDFQDALIGQMIHDTDMVGRLRPWLKSEWFEGVERWTVVEIVYAHFDKYGTAPGKYLPAEARKWAEENAIGSARTGLLLQYLEGLRPDPAHVRYLLDRTVQFAKRRYTYLLLQEIRDRYERGTEDIDAHIAAMEEVSRIGYGEADLGMDWMETVASRHRSSLREEFDEIPTLIGPLDERFGGIRPGELGTIMAASQHGKSWMMIHLAKAALMLGKHVIFYTAEMPAIRVAQRMDRMAVGVQSIRDVPVEKVAEAISDYRDRGGSLLIKWLEDGSGVQTIRNHIDLTIRMGRPKPDLILVDYGELLRAEEGGGKTEGAYEEQKAVWRGLHSLAVSRNLAIWTASQANRQAATKIFITEQETSDSYWKYRISDIFIAFRRNLELKGEFDEDTDKPSPGGDKRVWMYLLKNRDAPDRKVIRFASDMDRGQFYSPKQTELMEEWRERDDRRRSGRTRKKKGAAKVEEEFADDDFLL